MSDNFAINAYGMDGRCWALTIECESIEQVEDCINSLGLMVKPDGYGEIDEN